jgi:C-terminal processing protease CtpA/Prc
LVARGSKLNEFEIDEIRNQSPASDVGIQKGDMVTSIENNSTSEMSLNDVNSFLSAKPGKRISVVIKRNNQMIKKVFRLKSEI